MAHGKSKTSKTDAPPIRTAQHCAQCTAHGLISLLKGHKKICPFKDCTCVHCVLVNNKRQIMAKQVKLKRLQEKIHLKQHRRDGLKSLPPPLACESPPISPEKKLYMDNTETSNELSEFQQYQEETWRAACEPALDDRLSLKFSTSDQWCPISPIRFTHINPLALQSSSSLLQPCSPSPTMATNYLLPGDNDFLSLSHIQTQPVFYAAPGYAVSLAQANQLPQFCIESYTQPIEVVASNNGTPQSIDAAQTLLTLHTGEE